VSTTILVVEDNALNRKLVRDVLAAQGYDVLEAVSAEEGIDLARERKPALILMDIQLPGMDGIAATRLLRSDAATCHIKIIAITASVMTVDRERVLDAGFDGVEMKPISVAHLLDEVRRVIAAVPAPPRLGPATSTMAPAADTTAAHVLVVDDTPRNVRLLTDLLSAQGYRISTAADGNEALARIAEDQPDLVLLDVMMPGVSGYDVCRRLRADDATRLLPVILVTALDAVDERVRGIEAGADEFLTKPIHQAELFARVRSLLRIRALHETVRSQREELAEWNRALGARVASQVDELARLSRLKRFFPADVADAIARDDETLLRPHRRFVAVVAADLRGFTAFAEAAEPEEMMGVLREYHAAMSGPITAWGGTLEYFAGDGVVVVVNDPVEVDDPDARAVRMALAMRAAVEPIRERWVRYGFDLGVGFGVSSGYATAGVIGFDGRWDYTVVGTVMNQAARLVGAAAHGQILASDRVVAVLESRIAADRVGDLELKGLRRPLATYAVSGWRD